MQSVLRFCSLTRRAPSPNGLCSLQGQQRRCLARAKAQDRAMLNPAEASPRQMALAMALKQVELSHGRGSIMKLGSREIAKVEVVSSGSLGLDHALGIGGLPRGRVVEIYGAESSGKTTVALQVVAQCQKAGGTAVFIDAEHALDAAYAKALGVNLDDLYVSQPDNGEQALDIVETLVKSGSVDVVVVDSVAALVPRAELEGDMGDHHIALQARLMSQAMRKLTAALSRTNCLIVFINQTRQKVGVIFGNPEVTTGGTALRFYSSVRLEVRKGQQIKRDGEAVGVIVKVKVAKNKLAPPFGVAEFDLLFGTGVDRLGEILDLGLRIGLLRKSGAWFALTNDGCTVAEAAGEELAAGPALLGQGREKAKLYLAAHPALTAALEAAVRERLASEEIDVAPPGAAEGEGEGDGVAEAMAGEDGAALTELAAAMTVGGRSDAPSGGARLVAAAVAGRS